MLLETLRHRHDLFAAMEPKALAEIHHRVTAAALAAGQEVPSGVLKAVKADLVYAVARHRHFAGVALFADVLADVVATEYRLPRKVAEALAYGAVGQGTATDGAESLVPATDVEFLRSVFVASAAAPSETALIVDLGLGTALLARIRETVETAVSGESADGSDAVTRFLPELDAQIAAILCELARESKALPWALQIHRLRFHLLEAHAPLSVWVKVHGARKLYDLLLAIGGRGAASTRQVEGKLRKLTADFAATADDPTPLLRALAEHELVFCAVESENDDRRRWQLTPLALELTAEAFARNVVNTVRAPLTELKTWPAPYQAAVIRAADLDTAALTRIVLETRPLTPPGLRAALDRLGAESGTEAAWVVAQEVLVQESSPWLRKAVDAFLAAPTRAKESAAAARGQGQDSLANSLDAPA